MTPTTREKTIRLLANKLRPKIMFKTVKTWNEVLDLMTLKEGEYSNEIIDGQDLSIKVFNQVIEDSISRVDRGSSVVDTIQTEDNREDNTSMVQATEQDAKAERNTQASDTSEEDALLLIALPLLRRREAEAETKVDWLATAPDIVARQKAKLFKFQHKAAAWFYHSLYNLDYRGEILIAGTGYGKTFVYGQLGNWALEHQNITEKTYGPYPMMIVTKAPVVEQTTRVLRDSFGYGPFDCIVCSYDSLRSSFGRNSYIRVDKVVDQGEVREKFRWAAGIIPRLIILDEIQAAKNETSLQSRIIQALSLAKEPDVKVLCVSATPFTRVSEAKATVVNLGVPYHKDKDEQQRNV